MSRLLPGKPRQVYRPVGQASVSGELLVVLISALTASTLRGNNAFKCIGTEEFLQGFAGKHSV
jgi:hypothetical protein